MDDSFKDGARQDGAEVEERIVCLAFANDRTRYERFLSLLREITPPDAEVILRGSAVTGKRWEDGAPFDSDGPGTSDLDVTFVSGDLLQHWESFYIPGMHTVPLSEEHPDACPALVPLRRSLCELAGRPVNLQATRSVVQFARDVLFDQPYFPLIARAEGAPDESMPRSAERLAGEDANP